MLFIIKNVKKTITFVYYKQILTIKISIMKRVLLSMVVLAGLAILTTSCGKAKEKAKDAVEATKDAAKSTGDAVKKAAEKTTEAVKDGANAVKEGAEKTVDAAKEAVSGKIADGKKLFASKGCVACHKEEGKLVGPGLKEIAKVYADKKGNMVKFLKGNDKAIVDPAQFAVMQANLAITKAMKAEDLQALTAYIRSIK